MSFEISASGTNNFYLKKKGCEDGSTFNLIKVIAIMTSLDLTSTGRTAISGTGGAIDYFGKGITDLMIAHATREMLHNLSNAVCFLAMNPNSGDGWIYIDATETHTFWEDTRRLAKYNFSPGDSPGAEFIKTIGRALKDTGLDNFGVLQQLAFALSRFENKIDDSMIPQINIALTT